LTGLEHQLFYLERLIAGMLCILGGVLIISAHVTACGMGKRRSPGAGNIRVNGVAGAEMHLVKVLPLLMTICECTWLIGL